MEVMMPVKALISTTIFLFFSLLNSTTAQDIKIKKTWISDDLQYLKISHNYALFGYNHVEKYIYTYADGQLILKERYLLYGDKKWHYKPFNFEVIKCNTDTLILHPISASAKNLLENKEYCIFINAQKLLPHKVSFEKLYFANSCPSLKMPIVKLVIDSTGTITFFGKRSTGRYLGLYKGQLSNKELHHFLNLIQQYGVERFPNNLGFALDAPTYYFSIYHDGIKKESKGSFVPYVYRDLLSFLLNCYKHAHLKRYSGKVNFEH